MPVMINVEFKHVLGLPPNPSKNPNRYINVIFHIVKKQQYTRKYNQHIHICKQFKPQNLNYSNLLHSEKRTTTFDSVFFPNLLITTTKIKFYLPQIPQPKPKTKTIKTALH